ncbi:MAG: HEAT repeat domain-containing protein [Dehalococcoidia bacterium]|nr:HEAT repeat domain-containing protein [Dehalococcoidia bacterium]
MDAKDRAVAEVIEKVLKPAAGLLNADVSVLSNLNREGLAKFKESWSKANFKERLQLITKMVSLSEEDFVLDFTGVFNIGLNDPQEDIRIKALEGLEMEDKYNYARPIIKVLKSDESATVRAAAARALRKLALMTECGDIPESIGQEIFNALIGVLELPKEDRTVQRRALEAVACIQQEPVGHYIEDYYYNEDPDIKASAIFAMGATCNPRWLQLLFDEMQSEHAEFRFEAARAIGEIADEEAVPHLIRLLDDKDPEVQEAATMSLGKIGGPLAKSTLQKLSKSADIRIKDAAKAALIELSACEDPLSLNF